MTAIPLVKDELIGRTVHIKTCTDPTIQGITGTILDETQQMVLVESKKGKKWIAKQIATFSFPLQKKTYEISGLQLRYRPEERVKKAR